MRVLLVSTYELGRQPFGLASAAAWVRDAADVTCCDVAVEPFDLRAAADADLIAFYVPMHTATRLAADLAGRVREVNPAAHLCFFGLYAPVNEQFLRDIGGGTILGGEFEEGLRDLVARLSAGPPQPGPPQPELQQPEPQQPAPQQPESQQPESQQPGSQQPASQQPEPQQPESQQPAPPQPGSQQPDPQQPDPQQPEPVVSLARQRFLVPDRSTLPPLDRYAYLTTPEGDRRTVGYTEASRGCRHLCRHCPVVPVYEGRFRVVQREVVVEDVANQVAAGAEHITFGDPDFLNGPAHALAVVEAVHERFPWLTYDVTVKVEHLVNHAELLPRLAAAGCVLVTTAVESFDDKVLEIFDKRHTRGDVERAVHLVRQAGIGFNPTFVAFTPWTTRQGYLDFLNTIAALGLVANVSPVQYAIRLLVPPGSKLLDLAEVRDLVGDDFDAGRLSYRWRHPDPGMDELYEDVDAAVRASLSQRSARADVFATVRRLACDRLDERELVLVGAPDGPESWPVPWLSEPWYC